MTADRALSVKQPWAWAITDLLDDPKRVENRSRKTSFRGTFWIHASATLGDGIAGLLTALERVQLFGHDLPRGAIVGRADLYDCRPLSEFEGHGPDRWREGPQCYMLTDVVKLPEPVPCKGRLGFWKVPADVLAACEAQLEETTMPRKKKPSPDATAGATTDPAPQSPSPEPRTPNPDPTDAHADLGYGPAADPPPTTERKDTIYRLTGDLVGKRMEIFDAEKVVKRAKTALKDRKDEAAEIVKQMTKVHAGEKFQTDLLGDGTDADDDEEGGAEE